MKISSFTNNNFQLQGRIAETHEYSVGKAANITIAVDNGKDKDNVQRDPSFIQLKSFTPASYSMIKKGMKVRVYGHISTSSYEKDGKTIRSQDLIADYVEFLESKAVVDVREAVKRSESETANDENTYDM